MANNRFLIPFVNPIRFYDTSLVASQKYLTKHFDDWQFKQRLYAWQQPEDYVQIWQTNDLINLQFEADFSLIVVELIDNYNRVKIALPALIGLPNADDVTLFSYQVSMRLADLDTGCYKIRITAGSGLYQKTYLSGCQLISSEPIKNSILMEYWHNRFHLDVMFETGIKFQYRVHGNWGFLEPGRKDEVFRDQRYNNELLNSKPFRTFPLNYGDEYGLPDDAIDLINLIWSCKYVNIDDKSWRAVEGGKFDFTSVPRYPKRGVKMMVEPGINRYSNIFSLQTDPNKRLISSIMVDAKMFGDTANQGSGNTVPVNYVE